MRRRTLRASGLLSLGLALAGCSQDAPPPAASAPGASSPTATAPTPTTPGGPGTMRGMGGGMYGMGGGLLGMGGRMRGMGGMGGMGRGMGGMYGTGGGMGTEMGPGGSSPNEFPPWRLTPEAQAQLEARLAAMPPPNPPSGAADLAVEASTRPGRCAEHRRTHLYVVRGDALVRSQTAHEAVTAEDAVAVPRGGREPLNTLFLSALLPEGVTEGEVAVYPCVGEPFRVSVADLRANPSRYGLIENRRGQLKLLDATPAEGQPSRVLRNIAGIVVP